VTTESAVWVDGYLASGLLEIAHDPRVLERGGWWAVVGEFEGRWHLARFSEVVRAPLPELPWTWSGQWNSSMDRLTYISGVESLRASIAAGDIYQTNLCRILSASCDQDLAGLAALLQREHPAPFAAWMRLPSIEIVCASPERYLERDGGRIVSSPIKGTARVREEMTSKDEAENVMIVDLVRHDLSQVAVTGSVTTPRLLDVEEHPGLVHLVSDVAGELTSDATWADIFEATFPPGSVTGAPKISALELIRRLESSPRGPYCGAIGWINGDKGRLAVGIRTFWREAGSGVINFGTGAGITWGSDPESEWQETELKAERLMALANGKSL
jgi:para-aminobenzoate synthetase component I